MFFSLRHFFSFQNLKTLALRYERQMSAIGLLTGFIVDSLTLRRVDLLAEQIALATYLTVAGVSIMLRNLYEGGVLRGKVMERVQPWLPFAMQVAFGALFSGFVVFYFRSASLSASWPFLLFLAGMLVGNEMFRPYYERLTFHVSVFFIALFSFFIFYIPVVLHSMGPAQFLLSGAVSLLGIGVFLWYLALAIPERVHASRKYLVRSITGIFTAIVVLYFTNLIPPIPLSLKDAGVYQSVARVDGGTYRVVGEAQAWYAALRQYQTVHITPSAQLFFFSAVFAPTRLNTTVVHRWQYKDPTSEAWVTANRISFSITGGRDGGYRGYSIKENVSPGWWRVSVETGRGQVIGRVKFRVEYGSPRSLVTDVR